MSTDELVQLWVHAAVADTDNVANVRENLFELVVGEAPYQTESYPHVTVLPKIELPPAAVEPFRKAVLDCDLTEQPVVVTGTRIWPGNDDPRVVMLSINVHGLDNLRTRLLELVEELGGNVVNEPHKPHITLIRAEEGSLDTAMDISDSLKQALLDELETVEPFKTQLTSIAVDTFNATDGE
jgi:2'-5' RNA ligase